MGLKKYVENPTTVENETENKPEKVSLREWYSLIKYNKVWWWIKN